MIMRLNIFVLMITSFMKAKNMIRKNEGIFSYIVIYNYYNVQDHIDKEPTP